MLFYRTVVRHFLLIFNFAISTLKSVTNVPQNQPITDKRASSSLVWIPSSQVILFLRNNIELLFDFSLGYSELKKKSDFSSDCSSSNLSVGVWSEVTASPPVQEMRESRHHQEQRIVEVDSGARQEYEFKLAQALQVRGWSLSCTCSSINV